MGFKTFPTPKGTRGMAGNPCPDAKCSGTLVEWDCGCTFGCELCWVKCTCDKCGKKTNGLAAAPKPPSPVPAPMKSRSPQGTACPICGVVKVGLSDHMMAKHGAPPPPGWQKPVTVQVNIPLTPPGPRPANLWSGVPVQAPITQQPRSRLPPGLPLKCADCGDRMKLRESHYGLFYGCMNWPNCRGSHGANPDGTPKGIPGNAETRKLRQAAHAALDRLWQPGPSQIFGDRDRAYEFIQKALGLSEVEAHIAMLDENQCKRLIEALWEHEEAVSP